MTGTATKTETYTYIYEGQSIAMEILSKVENGGAPVKEVTRYVHSQRIDEPLAMERNGQYYYFHANRLGSVAAITNTAKAIVQSYTYDSFGMPEPSTSFRNSNTYTGREWDGETGLYYYRARYYDPMAGRFVSKDPIGFNGGDVNLYGYVGNNPINEIDPWGLYGIEVCTYYQQACDANGGIYECHMATNLCPFFPNDDPGYDPPGNWSNCVRQCLQERHRDRMPNPNMCSEDNNIPPSDNAADHWFCWTQCGRNPENPYNPNGPNLPDNIPILY